ncbi:hypothetical protein CQ13_38790 [Bradyrhizobium retamae]|uniref:Transposase n=1 Tax=Bradyrhizobium retamae TaxID=1300035 RepID=A0A0R3N9T8_9BRAD|nr:hypothetical protein CQ13_38790 [Bradyrhizobium retamae]
MSELRFENTFPGTFKRWHCIPLRRDCAALDTAAKSGSRVGSVWQVMLLMLMYFQLPMTIFRQFWGCDALG